MTVYEYFTMNRERMETHSKQFHKIFHLQLREYMGIITGFNIVRFDQHIWVPEGISTKDWVRQHFGEEAVTLIEALISPYKGGK